MAPEVPASQRPEVQPNQTVKVPAPTSGEAVVVNSSPSGKLEFAFNPADATVSRSGNHLVFETDNGGKVTVNDFFAVGPDRPNALPSIELPDGTVVASADFFANSEMDMSTAAGPAAAATPPGSGTNYADDAGSLLTGVTRLGSLGTDYWDRGTGVLDADSGAAEVPGGTFDFTISTGEVGVGSFAAGVFEDGMANQHLGDQTVGYGQIIFSPTLSGSTVVNAIRLSGFDAGTKIFLGDPTNPATPVIIVTGPTQSISFTTGNFADGVYLLPPANSDADMTISASIDVTAGNSGLTATLSGGFTVIVDAVADKPEIAAQDVSTGVEETTSVALTVSAQFGDYLDGSEQHFVELRGIPTDWILTPGTVPAGWTLVSVAGGTYRFAVDNATIAVNGGAPVANLQFNPQDWTDEKLNDGSSNTQGPAVITVASIAEETNLSGQDLSTDNNRAETTDVITVSREEGKPIIVTGQNLATAVDETPGLQQNDSTAVLTDTAVAGVLASLGYSASNVLSSSAFEQVTFSFGKDGFTDARVVEEQASGTDIYANVNAPSIAWNAGQAPAGMTTADGNAITFSISADGLSFIGTDSNGVVVCVAILVPHYDVTDLGNSTADVTFVQFQPLFHPDGSQHNDSIDLNFGFVVTDADGDTVTGSITVTHYDDAPAAIANTDTFNETADTTISGNVVGNDTPGTDGLDRVEFTGVAISPASAGTVALQPNGSYNVFNTDGTLAGTLTLGSDGAYSFNSTGGDIKQNFTLVADYTLYDKDQDHVDSTLTITVKAAPIFVGLVGDPTVYESAIVGGVEVPGKAEYTLQVYDYNGGAATGAAIPTDLTVTIKVELGTASIDDFDGVSSLPGYTLASDGKSFTFTQTISANDADGTLVVTLPIKDDAVGGIGSTTDANETYKVSITGVAPSTPGAIDVLQPGDPKYTEHNVTTSQDTVITDDGTGTNNRLDGTTPYNPNADTHPLDGPQISLGASADTIVEGSTVTYTLSGINPNTGGAYISGSGSVLEEPMTITLKVTLDPASVAGEYTVSGLNGSISGVVITSGANGQWTITLPKGFDLSKLGQVGIKVVTANDTLTESNEAIKVELTSVVGNESTYKGDAITTTVEDSTHAGAISISDATTQEGDTLKFVLRVSGTTINPSSSLHNDLITVTLQVGDLGDTATFGADYDVTLAAWQAANPTLTIISIDATGKVVVEIAADKWQFDRGDYVCTVKVPTIIDKFTIENTEKVTVTITDVTGAEISINNPSDKVGAGFITDTAKIGIAGTATITEDPAGNANIATYHVYIKDKGTPIDNTTRDEVAGQQFKFDVTLRDNGATFDSNTTDNFVNGQIDHEGAQDYGWAINNTLIQYGDLTTSAGQQQLLDAINDYLAADVQYAGIRVTGVSNGGRTLTFTVEKGANLNALQNLPIQVAAIDDTMSDPDEKFSVSIGNIQEELGKDANGEFDSLSTNGETINVITTITDDDTFVKRDGFLVELSTSSASENDKEIGIPVLLFERDANGNAINADPNNPPRGNEAIWLDLEVTGGTAIENVDYYLNGSSHFSVPLSGSWEYVPANGGVLAHWKQVVKIPLNDDRLTEGDETIQITLNGVKGHESDPLTPGQKVDLVIKDDYNTSTADGPKVVYFGADLPLVEPIAPNNDSGDPSVAPTAVKYSLFLDAVAHPDQGVIAMLDLKDTTGLGTDFNVVLTDIGTATAASLNAAGGMFAVSSLDQNLLDMLKAAGYTFGPLTLAQIQANLAANGSDYFLLVPPGNSVGSFTVTVSHDHDNYGNTTGTDQTPVDVIFEVKDLAGSEAVHVEGGSANTTTNGIIADDGFGPVVSIGNLGSRDPGADTTLTIEMGAKAGEDVSVTFSIIDDLGNTVQHTVIIPAGQTSVDLPFTVPHADYVYIKVDSVTGGEAQASPNINFADIDGVPVPVTFGNLTASNIYEEGETSVTYTVSGRVDAGYNGNDVSFIIKTSHSSTSDSDFTNGSGPSSSGLGVTLHGSALGGYTGKFDLVLKDGSYVLKFENGTEKTLTLGTDISITGVFPQAKDDALVEGNEGFNSIIIGTENSTLVEGAGSPAAGSQIVDNDVPKIVITVVDANGNPVTSATEGDAGYFIQLTLVDGAGNPITLTEGAALFKLDFSELQAKYGLDFATYSDYILIENGKSSGKIPLVLPNDFISEKDETFGINAHYVTEGAAKYPNGYFESQTSDTIFTVHDKVDGPRVTYLSTGKVGEDGSISCKVVLDKALEETAEFTFKVELDKVTDTKAGFILEDIKEFSVNGLVYKVIDGKITLNGIPTTSADKVYVDGDGNVIVKMVMDNMGSKDWFHVTLNNDLVTEGTETVKISLIGTQGGEVLDPAGNIITEANPIDKIVTVEDVLDGPVIGLIKVDAAGIEGETLTVGLSLSKDTVSDTTIELQLGAETLSKLVSGNTVTVSNAGGVVTTGTIGADGKVTINLGAGVTGPLSVEFDLQDNSLRDSNPKFEISLTESGIIGGESSAAGSLNFGSSFTGESQSTMFFDATGSGVTKADATCVTIIKGVPSVDPSYVTKLVFIDKDGTRFEIDGASLVVKDGMLQYTWPDKVPAGFTFAGGKFEVILNEAKLLADGKLAEAKMGVSVSGSLSGMSLSVDVNNETEQADKEGPEFIITADTTAVVEGAGTSIAFTIQGDRNGTGWNEVADNTYAQFKIAINGYINGDKVYINGSLVSVYGNSTSGYYVYGNMMKPVGSADPTLNVTILPAANSSMGDRTVSVNVIDSNSVFETAGTGSSDTVTVQDNLLLNTVDNRTIDANDYITQEISYATVAASLGITVGATGVTVNEGDKTDTLQHFTAVTGGNGNDTITIAGNGALPTINGGAGNDTFVVEASAGLGHVLIGGVGHDMLDYTAFTQNLTVNLATGSVAAQGVTGVDTVSGFEVLHAGAGNDTITASDAGNIIDAGAGNDLIHGGAGNDILNGGAGDDIIYTGAGNNTVRGGEGNDVMHSGTGNNTFVWHASEQGIDVIHDFKSTDALRFEDLLDSGKTVCNYIDSATVDAANNKLTLDIIMDGGATQTIELNFVATDTVFQDFVSSYTGATSQTDQAEILCHFITALSS